MLEQLKTKLAKFRSSPDFRAILKSDVGIRTSKNDSSNQTVGAGQTSGIRSKQSTITIDNSTTNNIQFVLPSSLGELSSEDLADLQNDFLQAFQNREIQFLKDSAANHLDGYKAFEKTGTAKEMIDYFTDKIPPEDLFLLRTGLYIKYLVEQNNYDRAMQIKENTIKDRHSRNVINLATAGYFETYIKPIFENNDLEIANKEYREVVQFLPEIVFVNNSMRVEDIILEVEEKIIEKEHYRISVRDIMVNGIGRQCAQSISEAEPLLHRKYPEYSISITKNDSNNLIHCKMQITLDELRP